MKFVVSRKWTHLFPKIRMHPYGRGRTGAKRTVGTAALIVIVNVVSFLILNQMYKFKSETINSPLIFTNYQFLAFVSNDFIA